MSSYRWRQTKVDTISMDSSMRSSMHSSDDRDVISKIGNHLDIMPLDPLLVLSPANAVFVDMATRTGLLRAWKT